VRRGSGLRAEELVARRPRADRLTGHQRRLLRELDTVAELTLIDFRRIREYDREGRTVRLHLMKDQLIRGFVINRYTWIDEVLGSEVCRYFFGERTFIRLWRTRRFRRFNYFILETMSLLEKLRLVHAIRELPRQVRSDVEALNSLRNGLAHAFFPQNLRAARPEWKGVSIFSVAGLQRFAEDMRAAMDVLARRFYGRRARRYEV